MENEFNIYNTLTGGSIENIKLNQKKENTEVPHSSNNIVEKTISKRDKDRIHRIKVKIGELMDELNKIENK